jgi:glutathione synthase/RimK-type ligase-like ATP-grasp enzyme
MIMSITTDRPIAVLHEHPDWFKPLFAELERRGLPYVRLDAARHLWDPAEREAPYALIVNRSSPSAYLRGHQGALYHTLDYVRHLERLGVPVVNGSAAYSVELSKAYQLDILQELGLPYPKSFVINDPALAPEAAARLRYPVLVKANVGGSGAGIVKYESPGALEAAVAAGRVPNGVDGIALVQEAAPLRDGHITRIEVLDGKYLYAIAVYPETGSFDLCPADACLTTTGEALVGAACAIDAPKRGLRVEAAHPGPAIIAQAERIARRAGIDIGGIEMLVDDRDGRHYFYDVNALSNFVADAPRVVGFDPWTTFVDYLERRAAGEPPSFGDARAEGAPTGAASREQGREGRGASSSGRSAPGSRLPAPALLASNPGI